MEQLRQNIHRWCIIRSGRCFTFPNWTCPCHQVTDIDTERGQAWHLLLIGLIVTVPKHRVHRQKRRPLRQKRRLPAQAPAQVPVQTGDRDTNGSWIIPTVALGTFTVGGEFNLGTVAQGSQLPTIQLK